MRLLDRAAAMAALAEALDAARHAGRLVLVSGEAGVGKTALVDTFCTDRAGAARALIGRCDDLFTPRPLGPLADIARQCSGSLAAAMARDDRAGAFEAFLDELTAGGRPVIAVLEDLQWADEATLDLVRFVARRLPRTRGLVVATHRDDLDRDHPLRLALGDLVPPVVTRIHLEPLSVRAVETMARGTGVDPVALHAATGGNPFFVSEVLAGGQDGLPPTVRDAVLSRAGHLSAAGREAIDAAAILGLRSAPGALLAVAQVAPSALDECVARGLLIAEGHEVAFRHDLTRLAIEDAMTPWRRRDLHARALAATATDADLVRRAHHAVGADDAGAVLDLARRAAAQCAALGAHREAAALLGSAVRYADALPPDERAELYEARARACARVDHLSEALAAADVVLAHRRAAGDPYRLAEWLTWLTVAYRGMGDAPAAACAVDEAVALLTPLGDSAALARALGARAQQHMVRGESRAAVDLGQRAQEMAERLGAENVAVHALNTVGTAMVNRGDDAGFDHLRASLARARAAGLDEDAVRACNNLHCSLLITFQPDAAAGYYEEGQALAAAREFRFFEECMQSDHAQGLTLQGRWDEAAGVVRSLLSHIDAANVHRAWALVALGRIRARRGDPDPFGPLDEALVIGEPYGELQMDHPIRMARAEAAWLAGDTTRAAVEVAATRDASVWSGSPWYAGEVALWQWRSGSTGAMVDDIAEPFRLHLRGCHREAAAAWRARGCVYEEADALGDSDDEPDLRRALERLQQLGARPRAVQVARRLRERGARSLPRGPRTATRGNPAGLTARELEVLGLLSEDLRDAEIADRLVVSTKTVGHHVSAILAKLAVATRHEAPAAAAALGWQPRNGERVDQS